jgi:hypothetical protein
MVCFLSYETHRIENDASNNSFIVQCVLVAAGKFVAEPLSSSDTHLHTDRQQGALISQLLLLAHFHYFEKNIKGLMRSTRCLCVCLSFSMWSVSGARGSVVG